MTKTQTFEQWMARVDCLCEAKSGLSIHDLPDCCFRDWFDDGIAPGRAATLAIREVNDE